ncbi:MAG: DUF2911 domain-containing protein [Ferruginibacter sp.]|nr:DUF2911 domain-containing protein [Ferruginibacter sp.]
MKQLWTAVVVMLLLQQTSIAQLTTLPDGGNKKAMVGERVGLTDITIHYNRPAVKSREGKIWGQLVPFGFNDLGFGTSKAAPWRAGANECTSIEFSTDVSIEGKKLAAGKYGFFIATGKEASTLIFSKNSTAWGSFFYDPAEDVLRVTCTQRVMDKSVEFLQYVFTDQTVNSATITLQWEKWMFAFKVETNVEMDQVTSFRKELQTDKGFNWQAFAQAANWCADYNTNLEEALRWADYAISGQFIGEKNFRTLSAKARILNLTGKTTEAQAIMKEAAPLGTMTEVHGYARQLLAGKNIQEASEFFRANYKKYPNVFTTNMGMARALSSEGKYKDALKYANAALPQAPDNANKLNVEAMIEKLKAGKDVN